MKIEGGQPKQFFVEVLVQCAKRVADTGVSNVLVKIGENLSSRRFGRWVVIQENATSFGGV